MHGPTALMLRLALLLLALGQALSMPGTPEHICRLVGYTSGEAGVPGPAGATTFDDSDDDRNMDAEALDMDPDDTPDRPDELMPDLCGDQDVVIPGPGRILLSEHVSIPAGPSVGDEFPARASSPPEHAEFAAASLECDKAWALLAQAFDMLSSTWLEAQVKVKPRDTPVDAGSPSSQPEGKGAALAAAAAHLRTAAAIRRTAQSLLDS